MAREIKFRAWHKEVKVMAEMPEPFEDFSFIGESGEREASDCSLGEAIFDGKIVEIMQYTGLKDKDGVEIYEGDIIGVAGQKCVVTFAPSKANTYGHGDCTFNLGIRFFGGYGNADDALASMRVIGNIYENPELLEAE